MAKTPENVYAFLKSLIAQYKPKADAETKAIEDFARQTMGADFQLEPYDRFYYSAKMKNQMLNISDDEIKSYFNVDSVLINGVFYAANRAYGLTFKQRTDIPTYHPDMKVFEVFDKDGTASRRHSSIATTSVVLRSVAVPGWMALPSRVATTVSCPSSPPATGTWCMGTRRRKFCRMRKACRSCGSWAGTWPGS